MDHIDPSRQSSLYPDLLKQGQLEDVSASDAASGQDGSSSEIGRVAQDIGTTIAKWSGKVNQALKDWLVDAVEIEGLMKVVAEVVPFLADLKKDVYSNPLNVTSLVIIVEYKMMGMDPSSLPIYLSQNDYNKMVTIMTDLGVPESEIPQSMGSTSYGGETYVAIPLGGFQDSMEIMKEDVQQTLTKISAKKNEETKDMFNVMFCYNAEKMNEESLTSAMKSLTSMAMSLEQNIS